MGTRVCWGRSHGCASLLPVVASHQKAMLVCPVLQNAAMMVLDTALGVKASEGALGNLHAQALVGTPRLLSRTLAIEMTSFGVSV